MATPVEPKCPECGGTEFASKRFNKTKDDTPNVTRPPNNCFIVFCEECGCIIGVIN